MRPRRCVEAAVAVLLALLLAGCGGKRERPLPSEPRVVSIVQDDAELLHRPPAQIAGDLDRLRALGVSWVRVTAGWSVIAPDPTAAQRPRFDAGDPAAYPAANWAALDQLYRMARARGLRVAIDIAFWAPRWAVSRPAIQAGKERDGIDPADYADFAEAVARRYPGAAAFTVWNEPNHNAFLLPQWERDGNGWRPASPHEYRRMLAAAVPRIKAAAPGAEVLIGGLSSLGTDDPHAADDRMAPLTFLRTLACVDARLQPLRVPECRGFTALPGDGFALHPYSAGRPPWVGDPAHPDTATLADLGRVSALLDRLHAAGRTAHALPLYLTEYGYQTDPPDPTAGVSTAEQARWLPEAERIARADPSVRGTAQFLLRDLPERPGPDLRTRWRDYQSGLEALDGSPKPAFAAYAAGLVARRAGGGRIAFWGLVRPGSGPRPYRVEVRRGGGWATLAAGRTDADGVLQASVSADPAATFRLVSGVLTGPPLAGAR